MPTRVFLAQPSYGTIEPESYEAVNRASANEQLEIQTMRRTSSLLANAFNCSLAKCLNSLADVGHNYFVLLHADVVPADGWLDVMIDELEKHDIDALHAPCAIKDGCGLTSTGIAYSNDPWQPIRRITTSELQQLPETFTIETIRRELEPKAYALLPNTGCLLLRLSSWIHHFPGFEIRDQLVLERGQWRADVVSEDWNFGFWAAGRSDCVVGATRKVTTRHVGKAPFTTEIGWGQAHDDKFFELRSAAC